MSKEKKFSMITKMVNVGGETNIKGLRIGNSINGEIREQIIQIRKHLSDGNKPKADELKKKLVGFTPSGTFKGKRSAENIVTYSNMVILDIDKVDDAEDVRNAASLIPYTMMAFISPSENGVKILIEHNAGLNYHKTAYKQIAKYYEEQLKISIDESGSDVARLCFFSYDPDLFYNEESKLFNVLIDFTKNEVEANNVNLNDENLFEQIKSITEKYVAFENGSRNNFVYSFACNCNRKGIDFDFTLDYARNEFEQVDFDAKEIKNIINSAYKNENEFGIDLAQSAGTAQLATLPITSWKDNPVIADLVYEQLPDFLKSATDLYISNRRRDIFLLASLSALSGCFPNAKGFYEGNYIFPNLYLFVTAKPGSGKGILSDGRKLIDQINKEKVETYINDLQQYETDITACEEDDSCKQNYVRPQSDRLIIPANSSTAALMKAIKENGGYIVLFESEADTLANTMAKEWGNFDDMLRKAFHHEAISSLRKQEDELIEIENPKISLILSGTPNQLTKLIQSAENGLLSRFLYYAFELEKKWISPFGKSQKTKFDMLEKLSNEAVELYNFNLDNPFEMEFSETQVKEFDNFLGNIYEGKLENDYESGVIARMGLILFRICLTLTAIRRFESQCKKELVVCSDKDFNIAKSIIETSIAHSRSALNYIESRKVVSGADIFYNKLPNSFKRSVANKVGKEIGIAERTVNNRLKKLTGNGKLKSPKKGEYKKTNGKCAKVANTAVVAS